jgi:uncharacterized protein
VALRRVAGRVAVGAAAAAGLVGVGATALGTYFARRAVTPDRTRPDDVEVLGVDLTAEPPTVTLRRTDDTAAPGRYGLWTGGGDGHARLGDVLPEPEADPPSVGDGRPVVRRLDGIDRGGLRPGPARWNQYYFAGPPAQSLGLAHQDVEVASELGPMPAWYVPAGRDGGTDWAILVHGRGASREECLRAVRPLHELGLSVLVPSYRNDPGAPAGPDGRHRLGDSEWRDVDAALGWVLARGGRRVVLCGWSMGGAIVLQTVSRSARAASVAALVLDAPVVDWRSVLDHHAATHRVPRRANRIGQWMLRNPLGHRAAGLAGPLDVRGLDWVARADELARPTLLVHSDQDEFVPNGPSLALARARPDLVLVEPWRHGGHTKEWNTDPGRWERALSDFVRRQLSAQVSGLDDSGLDPTGQQRAP